MSMTLNKLDTSKVTLGTNFLELKTPLDDKELGEVFGTLQSMQGSTLFWIGDFLNTVEMTKGEAYARAYTQTDYSPSTLWNAKSVCKQLPKDKRVTLSYTHHKEAINEAKGDVAMASDYLSKAVASKQTVAEMRKQIRLSLASSTTDETKDTIVQSDSEFLSVMDAFVTLRRFLENTTSKTFHIKKGFVLAEVEELHELATKVCQ